MVDVNTLIDNGYHPQYFYFTGSGAAAYAVHHVIPGSILRCYFNCTAYSNFGAFSLAFAVRRSGVTYPIKSSLAITMPDASVASVVNLTEYAPMDPGDQLYLIDLSGSTPEVIVSGCYIDIVLDAPTFKKGRKG